MKVSELPYKRVTLEEVTSVMEDVLSRIRNAKSTDDILSAREVISKFFWIIPPSRHWHICATPSTLWMNSM